MNLVLTHEQADFDALASLFGAALLQGAVPVLPRRMNRNVRSFITLYGLDFSFIDPRDLPQGQIESVTLVDTQSLITLKGVGKNTKIRVFDHHHQKATTKNPKDKNYPGDWEIVTFDLGATTTYFAEVLLERGDVLTPVQATLLLLGIYEDTGALTYSRTTARDVRIVAWLLDQGAELRSVSDFLNPPLSPDQRELYDQLVSKIETIEINGHQIMLACGMANNPTEEISTLAHKLRDLFDPDALFVLVQTTDGIRFVARSSTDQIDVSAVSTYFGGGGHNRAAAALVKLEQNPSKSLIAIRDELISILPKYVRLSTTVANIMSKRPRLIAEETPVQEVAKLMAKYGYEGFPVTKEGNIVGLLTRRAVDRATSHRLNLTAASLMESGSVIVYPSDSLQRLQSVMADSGWGQIPVVDPETKKVVGIVTRTDVLKILSRRSPHSGQYHSLVSRLQKSQSPKMLGLLRDIAELASNEHSPVFIVGGFVRDLILGQASTDLDMVVEGDAILLGKKLVEKFGGRLTCHTRFKTARWYLDGSTMTSEALPTFLDLITARQEFYEHPSALPTVEHGSIKHDLHRRDFTINTLALRLDGRYFGELHDYYGGLADIKRCIVRVLHSLSFIDDPTRMLRAVRYEQRYGFKIEPRTLQLIGEARPLVARLSSERLRHELDLLFDEKLTVRMLARMADLGLIKAISEYIPWSSELKHRMESHLKVTFPKEWNLVSELPNHPTTKDFAYCLWFMDLSSYEIDQLQKLLCFPKSTYKALHCAAALLSDLPKLMDLKPSQWVDRLEHIPLISVYVVYLVRKEEALENYVLHWRHIHPQANGHILKARGLIPGPSYDEILHTLRTAWLDDYQMSPQSEEALLDELIRKR